jgi:hypothetical protein
MMQLVMVLAFHCWKVEFMPFFRPDVILGLSNRVYYLRAQMLSLTFVLYLFQREMLVVAVHQLVVALAVVNVAVAEVDGDMARTVTSVVTMPMASREVTVAEALGMVL